MGMGKTQVAIWGAGGLGRKAVQIIEQKMECKVTAICDRRGWAFSEKGLTAADLADLAADSSVADLPGLGRASDKPIEAMLEVKGYIDGIFVALPNLPNEFIPEMVKLFVKGGYCGAFVDALKRTRAMELMFNLNPLLAEAGCTYITGAGATPGLLTAAAVLAAQSFTHIEKVDIWWGVGIDNWEEYRATIREDIAHLPGYDLEKAKNMSEEEIDKLLDEREGKLELYEMEHADDILLQRVGVVDSRSQVSVGGVMDTRSAKKPVSTTMTLTGTTYEGKKSSHRFILGDETTMAANVIGPAMGYLKRAIWLRSRGIFGVFGSTEFMPMLMK